MSGPRKMPNKATIKAHWSGRWSQLGGGFDSLFEFLERDYCWACGMDSDDGTERCHILARCEGGSDAPENLHLLCQACHKDSEFLSGDRYWRWLRDRGNVDGLVSGFVRAAIRSMRKEKAS